MIPHHLNAALVRVTRLAHRVDFRHAGQSMVEYAIVAALVAIVAIVAVTALGEGVSNVFSNILGKITGISA
ncbi:MAG: Flp family type IVb pilin [Chloroflexi bacterium]|nr:Flp family type IVb pilin [Chloroflexota bacterium]